MHPNTRKALKEQIKTLALDLRVSKKDLRAHMQSNTYQVSEQYHILSARKEYRHLHIAYCLARGRKLEEVENKTSPDNPYNMEMVNEYLADFVQMDKENDEKFPRTEKWTDEAVAT